VDGESGFRAESMRGRWFPRGEISNAASVSSLLINVYVYLWEGLLRNNRVLTESKSCFLYACSRVEWL
jgi:hypothetical protein